MEPFHIEKDDVELGVHIGEDGIIYVRMKGNLTSDHWEELTAWDKKVREAMRTASATNPMRALCLTDLSGGLEADEKSVGLLKDQVQHNKKFVTRTAVIGANFFMKTIMYMILQATHRTNMKPFDTREEAMAWLIQNGE